MKRLILILASLIAALAIDASLRADDRPKIYIRALISAKDSPVPQSHSSLISQFFENSMINMIKEKYDVMSHSTAKAMMTEKEELDALNCNDEVCMQTVIKAIQSEYLVYGEIQAMGKLKYIISVKLMHRRPGGLAVIEGSSIQQVEKIEFNDVKLAAQQAVNELLGNAVSDSGDGGTQIPGDNGAGGGDTIGGQDAGPQYNEQGAKSAAQLVSGSKISGSFTSPQRTDQWYKITAQKAANKTFTLNHVPGADFDFSVYDENRLVGTASGTISPESINATSIQGTCYIKVWNYQGTGTYTIDITDYSDPKLSAQREKGMTIQGNFPSAQRIERWYRLNGQEGITPTFTIDHDPSADFDFSIYRDDTLVATGQGTSPHDSVTCRLPDTGTTFVKVWNFRGAGNFTIGINRDPQATRDVYVGKNNRGQAMGSDRSSAQVVSAMSINGYFGSSERTEQWFRLTGQEGTNPTFTIVHDPSADFDFEVYNNDSPACSAQGTSSGDSVSCHIPGTCYIRVWNFRGNGNYTIQIRR